MIKPDEHILLVEDDELSSVLLEKYLSANGYAVTVIIAGELLENTLQELSINAVLLDIMLPGKDGLYWLEWLKQHYPELPVLLCSYRTSADERAIGLDKGADDYIVKPFHPKEILIRLRNILANSRPKQLQVGPFIFDASRAILVHSTNPDEFVSLTHSETLLLQLFFQNIGEIVTRDTISAWLHGNEHHPLRRNLDMLITRLRGKLADSGDNSKYLHTVWGKGYRFTPDP